MTQRGIAPVAYFGGKAALATRIIALFPLHQVYCEPYCGAASVFFTKPPAPVEILNDADGALINFFHVLRDPQKGARLREALTLTPYAREEWAEARVGLKVAARGWDSAADDVELARRWFVLTQQSFAGRTAPTHDGAASGWRFTKSTGHNAAQDYHHAIDRLPIFMERLANAQIEHDDALAIIPRYDSVHTLHYIDPPYLPTTRRGGGYSHEMTLDDHTRLLDALTARTLQGMVILSGYDSALYRERLERDAGWQRLEIVTTTTAPSMATAARVTARTEVLWLNPAAQRR